MLKIKATLMGLLRKLRGKIYRSELYCYFSSKILFRNRKQETGNRKQETGNRKQETKCIVYFPIGGLTDRFRGMVSLYKIAKDLNVKFKVNFNNPIDLSLFLVPNKYNWKIDKDEIIYDTKQSIVLTLLADSTKKHLAFKSVKCLLKKHNQIHVKTNMDILDNMIGNGEEYRILFNELFKPTDELKELIDYHLLKIGDDFISVTYRFQQLLGDFKEGQFPTLSLVEQNKLIDCCIEKLKEIYNENNYKKILVTSDSATFLNKIKEFDYVYVIPGKVAHIDHEKGLQKDVYMKSFVDYYLLTYSKHLYSIVIGQMYPNSGFVGTAARHANKQHSRKTYIF